MEPEESKGPVIFDRVGQELKAGAMAVYAFMARHTPGAPKIPELRLVTITGVSEWGAQVEDEGGTVHMVQSTQRLAVVKPRKVRS